MPETTKVKLSGGPEQTHTCIWLAKGQLKVEFYDFGELAQRVFGNDIACTLTVIEMEKVFSITGQDEASLIPWLQVNYKSDFYTKKLLEERGIAFHKEIESWT
jgi:hypothetical protein